MQNNLEALVALIHEERQNCPQSAVVWAYYSVWNRVDLRSDPLLTAAFYHLLMGSCSTETFLEAGLRGLSLDDRAHLILLAKQKICYFIRSAIPKPIERMSPVVRTWFANPGLESNEINRYAKLLVLLETLHQAEVL